jgi:hypothetical protein
MPIEEHVRFPDLQAAGIVNSWPQLRFMQEKYGFPLGKLAGANTRIFPVSEINQWLANCPIEASPLAAKRGEKLQEVMRAKRANGWRPRLGATLQSETPEAA